MSTPKYRYRWTMRPGDTIVHAILNDGTGNSLCGLKSVAWLDRPAGGIRAYLRCQACGKLSGVGGQVREKTTPSVLSEVQHDVLTALDLSTPRGGMRLPGVPPSVRAWLMEMGLGVPVSLVINNPKWTITDAGRRLLPRQRLDGQE